MLLAALVLRAPLARSAEETPAYDLRAGAWDRSVELEEEARDKEALSLLERAYGSYPESYEVTIRMAWLSLKLEDEDRAIALYRRARGLPGAASEATDGLCSALVMQGVAALSAGQRSRARRAFREALALRPERADAKRGLWLAREQRFEPEGWIGYLSERSEETHADGWVVFTRLPYQMGDHGELRLAYRHNEVSFLTPTDAGAGARTGRSRSRFGQDELYAGFGMGTRHLWVDLLGIALWSTTEDFVPGESFQVRMGRQFGLSLEQTALRRADGWNVQLFPLVFLWPLRILGLSAGVRATQDHLGREYSVRAGFQLNPEPFIVYLGGHWGRERWPVTSQIPMVITVEQDLTMGASFTTVVAATDRLSLGISGQLERIEDVNARGFYGNIAGGMRWAADL